MVGSAGSMTFKRVAGRTVVSEKSTVMTNPRTAAQQRHRMKWPNMIRMYSGISPLLRNAFEGKAPGVSDYNMFLKHNFSTKGVYLTKAESAAKSIVAAPYIVSDGSLRTIKLTGEPGASVTDISLGSLSITASTTVGDFSKAVVVNNKEWNFGDQLSFILVVQEVNEITGYPRCTFEGFRVELDKESEICLLDLVGTKGFAVKDGKLACQLDADFQGAYVWVHSRKEAAGTLVSTQVLIVKNDLYERYTSVESYRSAVQSYGGENNAFLTPIGDGNLPTDSGIINGGNDNDPGNGSGSEDTGGEGEENGGSGGSGEENGGSGSDGGGDEDLFG